MKEYDKVRVTVSSAYANAVTAPKKKNSCCSGPAQKGAMVKTAGYTSEELESLPSDAVVNSFGCGNPLAYSEVKEGEVVLDLGSGAGIDILLAARKVGLTGRAIGIDMTDEMIAKARENIAASGLTNVEVRKGIIEDLPVDSASVDWVISNCVINLSPEKHRVFAEIARVLKPGGRILISDIVVSDLPDWARQNEALYCSCVAGAISEDEYVEGLKEAGLADVEVRARLVYDAVQLEGFIASELDQAMGDRAACCAGHDHSADSGHDCCGAIAGTDVVGRVAQSMTGKIWSAKFYGKKAE